MDSNDRHLGWFYWVYVPLFLWLGFAIGSGGTRGVPIGLSQLLIFPAALSYWILMPLCFRKLSIGDSLGHLLVFGIAFCAGLYADPKLDEMSGMALPFLPLLVAIIVFLGAIVLVVTRSFFPAKSEHLSGESPKTWGGIFIISLLLCSGLFTGLYYLTRESPEVECVHNIQYISCCLPTELTPDIIQETKPGWCDYVKDKMSYGKMKCRLDKIGPCSYALNKNLVGLDHWDLMVNQDPNVVFLFESKPGWNQIGGPELLESHGHFGKKGVYVYLIGRGVVHVEESDIPKLKWIPDEDK